MCAVGCGCRPRTGVLLLGCPGLGVFVFAIRVNQYILKLAPPSCCGTSYTVRPITSCEQLNTDCALSGGSDIRRMHPTSASTDLQLLSRLFGPNSRSAPLLCAQQAGDLQLTHSRTHRHPISLELVSGVSDASLWGAWASDRAHAMSAASGRSTPRLCPNPLYEALKARQGPAVQAQASVEELLWADGPDSARREAAQRLEEEALLQRIHRRVEGGWRACRSTPSAAQACRVCARRLRLPPPASVKIQLPASAGGRIAIPEWRSWRLWRRGARPAAAAGAGGSGEGGRPSTGASSAASAPAGWAGPGLRVTEDSGGSSRPGSEHSEPAWAQHRPHRPLGLSKLATMRAGQGRRAAAADAAAGGGRAARMSWGGGPPAALATEPRSFDPGGSSSEAATTGSSTPRLSHVLSDQSLPGEACGPPPAAGSEERQPAEWQEWQQESPGAACAAPQALLRVGRLAAEKLVAHPDFNLLVLLLILASCVQLALYRPLEPDGSPWNAALGRVGEWLCGGWAGPVHGGCGHKGEVAAAALNACNEAPRDPAAEDASRRTCLPSPHSPPHSLLCFRPRCPARRPGAECGLHGRAAAALLGGGRAAGVPALPLEPAGPGRGGGGLCRPCTWCLGWVVVWWWGRWSLVAVGYGGLAPGASGGWLFGGSDGGGRVMCRPDAGCWVGSLRRAEQ